MTFPYKDDEYKNNAYDYERWAGLEEEEEEWTPWDDVEEEYYEMSRMRHGDRPGLSGVPER